MRKFRMYFGLLFLLIGTALSAQVSLDLKVGINNSGASLRGVDSGIMNGVSSKTLPSIGIAANYALDKHFFVSSGAAYRRKGFDLHEGTSFTIAGLEVPIGVKFRYTENVIDVPLHLGFTYPTAAADFYAKVGASAGIGLGGNYKTIASSIFDIVLTDDPVEYGTRINKTDISADFIVGGKIPYGNGAIILEVQHQKGLTDKINDKTFDVGLRNKSWTYSLGYSLKF